MLIEGDDNLIDDLMKMAHYYPEITKKAFTKEDCFGCEMCICDTCAAPLDGAGAPSDGADMVNKPPHYQSETGVECIEAIEAANGMDGFIAYLRGTAIKYIWRAGKKWDDVEDVEKAIWYMERMKECLNRKQLP